MGVACEYVRLEGRFSFKVQTAVTAAKKGHWMRRSGRCCHVVIVRSFESWVFPIIWLYNLNILYIGLWLEMI